MIVPVNQVVNRLRPSAGRGGAGRQRATVFRGATRACHPVGSGDVAGHSVIIFKLAII